MSGRLKERRDVPANAHAAPRAVHGLAQFGGRAERSVEFRTHAFLRSGWPTVVLLEGRSRASDIIRNITPSSWMRACITVYRPGARHRRYRSVRESRLLLSGRSRRAASGRGFARRRHDGRAIAQVQKPSLAHLPSEGLVACRRGISFAILHRLHRVGLRR